MKAMLLKPTMLVMVMLCMMESIQDYCFNNPQNNAVFFGGHIEVIGDFLVGDTGDPNVQIEEITLLGAHSYTAPGCDKRICSFNISNVINGTYEASIHGSEGYLFTVDITVKR